MFPPQPIGAWWFSAAGMELPEDEVGPTLEPEHALDEVEALIAGTGPSGSAHRWQLVLLRQSVEPRGIDWPGLTLAALHDWLRQAVRDGLVVMQELMPATLPVEPGLDVVGLHRVAATWRELEDVAVSQGRPVPAHVVLGPTVRSTPHQTYQGTDDTDGLADEIAPADSADPEACTADNKFSESMATVAPDVRAWVIDHIPAQYRDATLGQDGGGGFVTGSTRLIRLPKGLRLVRAYGKQANPLGCWWSLYPYAGDPRVSAALPESNSAEANAVGVIREDTTGLIGIGAPRCSNKPGGPPQIWVPFDMSADGMANRYVELEARYA